MRAATLFRPLVSIVALALAAVGADARSATGDRVLVLHDGKLPRDEYSQFFASLEKRGFELDFRQPTSADALLNAFGEPLADHLVIMSPEIEKFSKHITPQALFDAQGTYLNTLFVLSPETSAMQRELLRQYGVEIAPEGASVYDAFSHVGGGSASDVVVDAAGASTAPKVVLPRSYGPVVYPSGTAFTTSPANPFLLDIFRAPPTAYVGDKNGNAIVPAKGGQVVEFAGSSADIVAALQTRANSRIGFVGSPGMLANTWWGKKLDGKETGNRALIEDFTKWLFQETGVVRVVETAHHKDGESEPLEAYTKNDPVTYTISLQQHTTSANGSSAWEPFHADDLQLEFTMLDPHVRTALQEVVDGAGAADSTTYTASFRAPDRHGVFKFVVNYFRPGWSYITTADRASVVPLRHDEHPRWITGAFPFYTGCLSTSVAFLFFVALWMHLGEGDKTKKKAE